MSVAISEIEQELQKRRTFAIVSHPDAGKTTLTEQLLLSGGAIREAGLVKAKGARRHATSDWMEIEQKRGISVTSTALQFEFHGYKINLLDTPGHEDFSEDTYRTLTAADSAVMLIDAAKGIEAQTIKLFQVCRMRNIPIFTFVNKLDREGRDPLDLLKEIEDVLGVKTYAMNWPVGMGVDFQGIFNREENTFESFQGRDGVAQTIPVSDVTDSRLEARLGTAHHQRLVEDLELLEIAGDPFSLSEVRQGALTPVFFGSAITRFGVETFLKAFVQLAPAPGPRKAKDGLVEPTEPEFSGFVFKIQANMNPAHRDRVAFIRVCSGKFERGMQVRHIRSDKSYKLAAPQQFFGQDRSVVDVAFPGDIIGVHDPGIFRIGDTLSTTGSVEFEPLPQFSPEYFARVTMADTSKYKQFHKGLQQLGEEGSVQVFRVANRTEDIVLGVVGQLQFETFEYRMKAEYGCEITTSVLPYEHARWVGGNATAELNYDHSSCLLVKDQHDRHVLLFPDNFTLRWATERNPNVGLYPTTYELDKA